MMNTDYRPTNSWDFRLRAAKLGELVSVRSLAALTLTVALIALLATLATLLATPLQAQSLTTFVSNVNNITALDKDDFQAQSLETGANEGGYTVSRVEILLGDVSGKSTSVNIRENNADNEPGDLVTTLANPGTLTSHNFNIFTAQPVITLAASTTYWISVNEGISSDRMPVSNTSSDDEYSGSDWSIGDDRLYRTDETASWTESANPLMIAILGTISADATLSALALEGADGGETITLSPTFDDDTENYTASVVNRIDAVKLTATKNDDNAMVVITNDDDQTGSPDEAVLDLNVGSNTLTMTVTAQDGTATRTYTITATRAAAPPAPTDCPSDTAWCTTMTLGYVVETRDSLINERFGYDEDDNYGDLGTATFTHGGTTYRVLLAERFVLSMDSTIQSEQLQIVVSPELPDGSVFQVDNLTFTVDEDSSVNEGLEEWNLTGSPLSWTEGQHVTVSLKLPAVPISLVSNTHLSATASNNLFQAQSFETGPNAGGYTVSEVDMRLGTASGRSARVSIRDDDTGKPGDLVATLTNPGTLTADSLNTFTPPAGTTLAASTTYWITVNEGISSNRAEFRIVSQNGQTGETGWNIGDSSLRRVSEADIWSTSTSSLLMAIKGTAIPTISLVSNTHLRSEFNVSSTTISAQKFETGANLDGYTVSEVDIPLTHVSGNSSTIVKIRENNATNRPGNLVATLTNPASLTADSLNTFTAPPGTTLAANKTYWLTMGEGISTNRAQVETHAGNDETGEPDWSIGDGSLWKLTEDANWQTNNNSLLMTIKGTVVPCDGIWCATLTVQDLGDGHRGCGNASDGNECSVAAHLSEDEFTHAMTDYSVGAARVQSDGQLQLYLNRNITTDSESLVLHVGSETFAFEDANAKGSDHRKWNGSGLSWTTGDAIGLKLTDAANATGQPTISGVPQVGMVLEAKMGTIADTNGLPSGTFPSDYTFQWVRVATDSTETNLGTDSTYMVSPSDVDSTIRVDVSFTDLAGNSEGPLPSVATAAVVPAAAPCPADNDWCATMTVGILEDSGTSYGFLGGLYGQLDETTIDYGPSFEVERISIFEPEDLSADLIYVILDATVPDGTVFNLGGTEFTVNTDSRFGSGIHIWSRPANLAWIVGQEVRVSANLAPAPESATVDGTSLVLTHSEDLDTGSVPAASAYTVKVDGDAGTNPSTVSVGTRTVTLTLATAVIDGQVVTVSYDMPASNRLQDVSGRNAPAFNNFAVTNNTEAVYRGPTFTEGTDTTRTFEETFGDAAVTTATNIGQPVAATDPDTGETLTYTLEGTDAGKFDIVSTSGQLLTKVGTKYDYEQQRTYSVTVVVEDSDDNSDEIMVVVSVEDQDEPPLEPTPVFVSPTSGSASKLNVSWHRPTNTGRPSINNYDLQYREVGAVNYTNGPQNVSGSRTTISGLRPSTVYEVQVRATNAEGDGPWTPAVRGSTSQNSEPDPPAVTYGLRATGVSQTRIDLSWNAPTDDGGASITGYRIEVSDDGGSTWSDLVANTRSSSRTYAHTGLTAGVTRHYRVSAINRVNTGLASAVASGQTQAANATPKRPSTMYLYFTVSNSDWNESEEVKYSGNRIDGDCSGEKYFRAFWTEPNSPPVDEWEVQATPFDGASAPSTQVRYSNGNREYPEFIGSAQFATGSGEGSYINFAVRGRYGDTWGTW